MTPPRRVRSTGLVTAGLFVGTALTALALAEASHLGVVTTLIAVLVSGGAPAGLYLTWATYVQAQGASVGDDALNLEQVADQFALAVRDQWEAEARSRRLNDPYPLPVRWLTADASLVDPWDGLITLAMTGAGRRSAATEWADGPSDLAGEGNQLADVLQRVPTGRLVVLGEPGAGKTMLMVRLVLDLLERRASGAPVPVLVSAAAWDPRYQGLHEWLLGKLSIDYPALTAPARDRPGKTQLEGLLAERLITLLLDGLDEIPDTARGRALVRINDAIRPGERLVLTSRTAPYRDAITPSEGAGVTLRAAAGIELCPLDPIIAGRYLCADTGGSAGENRWASVITSMAEPGVLAEALSSPLMVGLARVIYNPRPGEDQGDLPNPAALCQLESRTAIESQLLGGFIQAAYRGLPHGLPRGGRWTMLQAERWLMFLADHLERVIHAPDLAWWQLHRSMPRRVYAITIGLTVGLISSFAIGLATAVAFYVTLPTIQSFGISFGVVLVLIGGFISGAIAWLQFGDDRRPSRGARWKFVGGKLASRRIFGLLFGFAFGAFFGLAFGPATGYDYYLTNAEAGVTFAIPLGLVNGIAYCLPCAMIVGLAGVLAFSLEEVPGDISAEASPKAVLALDRRTTLASGITFGLSVALALSLIFPRVVDLASGASNAVAGGDPGAALTLGLKSMMANSQLQMSSDQLLKLQIGLAAAVGLTGWLTFSLVASRSVWPRWQLARCWLALRQQLPWRLMSFLDDAHRRGVLRQTGAVYQFRHIELQHRLSSVWSARERLGSKGKITIDI